jgi:phage/plasmid-like protein (TIGR03299 family)
MSAEVETMMYAKDTPWHGLGVYVGDEDVDSKTAIIKAGLDWQVEKQPLYASRDQINSQVVDSHKAVVRTSDQKVLGVVGNRYHPLQNIEAFTFMDSLVEEGRMKYHTAGSLRGGQKIWLLGKVSNSEIVPGDQVDNYIFLHNTHDGTSSLRVLFTNVRVVCANTAQAALQEGQGEGMKIRHTINIKDRMRQAQEILGFAKTNFHNFNTWAKSAARTQLSANQWDSIVERIIPLPPIDKVTNKVTTMRQNIRDQITELYYNGTGQDIPGVAGTGWAAYNAVVEYANYYKKARSQNQQEKRFEASLFGSSAQLIQKAVTEISKAA